MKNYYEILGIKPGASKDEIRSAYKTLVKKYHPDQYANNPLSDLASEKLKEINEAYDALTKNSASSGNSNYNRSYSSSNNNSNSDYQNIRLLIQQGRINQAEQLLNQNPAQTAEWNYLMGVVFLQKGWHDQGRQYLQRAVQMEPTNFEYRNTLNRINTQRHTARNYNSQNADMCNICGGLICADCLCECCGGDLIGCC